MAAHGGALPGTRIRVTRAGDHLVVRLGSRFTEEDLDVVRRIRGRRWLPDERAWLLPDTQEAMVALIRGFGPRLHGDSVPADSRANTMPGAAADTTHDAAPGVEAPQEEEAVAAIRQATRLREYSRRTEQCYVVWGLSDLAR